MEADATRAFEAASEFLVSLVERVPADAWDGPGLGQWTVRELAAHAQRAYLTIEEYVTDPRPPLGLSDPYFSEENIAARARAGAIALGDRPTVVVAATAQRVRGLVRATPADATVGSPMATTTLADYLPSRTAELTIHGLDLAAAIGVDAPPPPAALASALTFVATAAVRRGKAVDLLLAATGRAPLAPGFSVY